MVSGMSSETLNALSDPYEPKAVYFSDSDCIEYVREDTICVYDRVDKFLTLIYDETNLVLIGFKLKGIKYIFNRLSPKHNLSQDHFVEMIEILTAVCTDLGNELTADQHLASAYKAAKKLARQYEVRVELDRLPA